MAATRATTSPSTGCGPASTIDRHMRLPKEFVEGKLSAVLGARVAIDGLSASLLGGSIDVNGVTVTAHGATQPILVVRRINCAGGWINLRNEIPADKPVLVWFWAPY